MYGLGYDQRHLEDDMIGDAEDKFLPLPYLSPHKNLFPLLQVRTRRAVEEFH